MSVVKKCVCDRSIIFIYERGWHLIQIYNVTCILLLNPFNLHRVAAICFAKIKFYGQESSYR